jgi:5-(carboxyamino)imidazole ribonucleotide synthase
VSPEAPAIAIAQDRIAEKAHFTRCGVPCAPYAVVETAAQLAAIDDSLLPGILKTARLGYDGKGQQRVKTRAELVEAWQATGCVPCVLEKMLPLEFECSVILARGRDGQIVHFPPQRNLHRDGILAVTEVHPQNMPKTVAQGAVNSAKSIAERPGLRGRAVRRVLRAGRRLAGGERNGAAPAQQRPLHDGSLRRVAVRAAGAHACRPAAGGVPRQHSPALMLNLLGDLWFVEGSERTRHAALERRARAARRPPAPLRQGRPAPRPQDGPPDLHRRHARSHVRAAASQAALLLGLPAVSTADLA